MKSTGMLFGKKRVTQAVLNVMMLLNVTQNDQKCYNAVADPREGPGGPAFPPLPPYFYTKMRPKRAEKNFLQTAPPPYLRVWMTSPPSEGLEAHKCNTN